MFLAAAVVAAELLKFALQGRALLPSPAALILAASLVLAGMVLTFSDPAMIKSFIPGIGATAWVALLLREDGDGNCRN